MKKMLNLPTKICLFFLLLVSACTGSLTTSQPERIQPAALQETTTSSAGERTPQVLGIPTESVSSTPTSIATQTIVVSPTQSPEPAEFKLEYRNGVPWCEAQAGIPDFVPGTSATAEGDEGFVIEENSLRSLAEQAGIYIGTAVEPWQLGNEDVEGLLPGEFNLITPENAMKWERIHPQPDVYDFEGGDKLVAFAEKNGMNVRGHTLVWDYRLPEWVNGAEYSRDEWIYLLCRHVKTVASHYRGHIYAWDVVNEAFHNDGYLRDTIWLRNIGPEYIPWSFIWAHQADPNAVLVYNDHSAEGINPKSDGIYELLSEMKADGVPVQAVGMQMHIWLDGPPTPADLEANMQRFADLGLKVQITEMDVRTQYSSETLNVKFQKQAQAYRQVFKTCLEAPNCNVFVTWGISDRYSWIPGHTGKTDYPLLFDFYGHPKSAYYAIRQVLQDFLE